MKKLSILIIVFLLTQTVFAQGTPYITLATTTSTENSGLLGYLHPLFTKDTGIEVRVIAKGSGAALEMARNGDADIVMAHSRDDENTFMADGYGTKRYPLMHNDFILVGPKSDPARIMGLDIISALKKIAESKSTFISRGDNSGTHVKENQLWEEAAITPDSVWLLSVGQGMSKVLTIAAEKHAYTLSDRATWLALKDKLELIIVSERSPLLDNPYCVIPVNSSKHPHVKYDLTMKYVEWLISEKGQRLIGEFQVNGQTLFYPDIIPVNR